MSFHHGIPIKKVEGLFLNNANNTFKAWKITKAINIKKQILKQQM